FKEESLSSLLSVSVFSEVEAIETGLTEEEAIGTELTEEE
ncbi:9412_t:CDS:1, partial [Gigaspora rosea]